MEEDRFVHLWVHRTSGWESFEADKEQCFQFLSQTDEKRNKRFLQRVDAMQNMMGRLFITLGATSLVGLEMPIAIGTGARGKPYLLKAPTAAFNVSHGGDWVAYAYDSHSDHKVVGVDVMPVHLTRPGADPAEFMNSMEKCFSPREWTQIRGPGLSVDAQLSRFFLFWTMKESFIKYVGKGLAIELDRLEFVVEEKELAQFEMYRKTEGKSASTGALHRFLFRPSQFLVDGQSECVERTFDVPEPLFRFVWLDGDHVLSICAERKESIEEDERDLPLALDVIPVMRHKICVNEWKAQQVIDELNDHSS